MAQPPRSSAPSLDPIDTLARELYVRAVAAGRAAGSTLGHLAAQAYEQAEAFLAYSRQRQRPGKTEPPPTEDS